MNTDSAFSYKECKRNKIEKLNNARWQKKAIECKFLDLKVKHEFHVSSDKQIYKHIIPDGDQRSLVNAISELWEIHYNNHGTLVASVIVNCPRDSR